MQEIELFLYSNMSQSILLLCGIVLALLNIAAAHPNSVPITPKTCSFKTDHPLSITPTGDFELVLIRNGSQVSCYEKEEMNTGESQ